MSEGGQLSEIGLGQPFRLGRGQAVRIVDAALSLRKVAFTRREPARGFEELGDELILTLELCLEDGARRRSFSWRENDPDGVCASWAVGDLSIEVDRQHVFRVTRRTPPEARRMAPPEQPPPNAPAGEPEGSLTKAGRGSDAGVTPPQERSEERMVKVRRRRKKRRRSWYERLLGGLKEALVASFRDPRADALRSPQLRSRHRRDHHRASAGDDTAEDTGARNLTFEQKVGWAWSLRFLEGEHAIGVVQGANPFALLGIVEEHFVAFGGPKPGYSVILRNVVTRRELAIDRETLSRLRSENAEALLRELDRSYPHHTLPESASTTLMTDEHGRPTRTDDLLERVFDPDS